MTLLDIILLSIGLAMDCFAVSIGLGYRRLPISTIWKVPVLFGLFQGTMPLIGFFMLLSFAQHVEALTHWIALVILSILGIKMILEDLKDNEPNEEQDKQDLTWGRVVLLAIATSIDALMTGTLFVAKPEQITLAVSIITLGSFLFSCLGLYLGNHVGKHVSFKAGILGGVILICVGIKIVIEHYL